MKADLQALSRVLLPLTAGEARALSALDWFEREVNLPNSNMASTLTYQALTASRRSPPLEQHGKRVRTARGRTAESARALFLDFDGVLHPTVDALRADEPVVDVPLFGWLPTLTRVLRPYPDVSLVIHSSWRYAYDVDELREMLGGLGKRLVGTTARGARYESIRWFLQQNPLIASHRILDDDASEFPAPPPAELILCNPRSGVAAPDVLEALRAWLQEC